MASFIRVLGPKLREAGGMTQVIVADTANGQALPDYATQVLNDKTLARYLGPIGFHCWDALSAKESDYLKIAETGKRFGKEIWCLEAGHDAQLWQASGNPWKTWQNAMRTAQAYIKTVSLTGCSTMAYWTYEDDYPIVSPDGRTKYQVFDVLSELSRVLDSGTTVVDAKSNAPEFPVLAAKAGGALYVVGVNTIGSGTVMLSGLSPNRDASVRIQIDGSSSTKALKVNGEGRLGVNVPAGSFMIVTIR